MARGFTLIEIIIAVSIFVILSGIIVGGFVFLQQRSYLNRNAHEFVEVLRLARNKSLASEDNLQYGIYINTATSPNQYTLFKGSTYAERDQSYDRNYSLIMPVSFSAVNLGGENEINFNRLTGSSEQSGNVILQYGSDTSKNTTIYISNSGAVSFDQPLDPSDDARNTDSRHVHFDYTRLIVYDAVSMPCTGETIDLYFDGSSSPQQQIPVCSNIEAGDIKWSGTVDPGGAMALPQTIEIHTHGLNSPHTQFSIHRDGMLNDVSFRITISGDVSGDLINYLADGSITNYSSTFVENLIWQ